MKYINACSVDFENYLIAVGPWTYTVNNACYRYHHPYNIMHVTTCFTMIQYCYTVVNFCMSCNWLWPWCYTLWIKDSSYYVFSLPIFVQKWFYFISCAFPFIYEITALHGTKFIYIHVDLPIRKGLIIPMHWFE